jgi:hypothetical protein
MVPKLHAKRTHFRGTAKYLLHDIGGKTAERVAWTEIRNVSSRNPDVAWRVMAATAMDQDRLKQQAGIPNTGRKSKDHALHFSLAWHPEERDKLTRQEMVQAASAILKVMGADQHQAIIVAHNDGHPHIHVLVNRVNPHDGRILSSSFEKLKASRWAEEYEKARGKIYCEQRVINNQARDREEYTRGEKDQSRHLHDLDKAAVNDNDRKQKLLDDHRLRAHALKESARQQAARRKQAWLQLEAQHKERLQAQAAAARLQMLRIQTQIRESYRPLWEQQFHDQQAALRHFEQKESRLLGRIQNAVRSIDLRALIGRDTENDGRAKTISEVFQVLSNSGARQQAFKRQQEITQQSLARRQLRDEQEALRHQQATERQQRARDRDLFLAERSSLIFTQAMEAAKLKTQWHDKGLRMKQELRAIQIPTPSRSINRSDLTEEFQAAAQNRQRTATEHATEDRPPTPQVARTSPGDLLPKEGAKEAARKIDQWREFEATRFGRPRERDLDRDDDRER